MSAESRLVFVEDFGAPEGFRSGEGTDDEIVVRELVQNALDAGASRVEFRTLAVSVDDLPDIDGYREAVKSIHPDLRRTPVAMSALERIRRALDGGTMTCLLCTDDGVGLGESDYRRLLSEAMSTKVGNRADGKLGSVGVGHLTALDASAIRYVLYASNGPDGHIFGGQAILASQNRSTRSQDDDYRARHGCLTAARHENGFRGYKAHPADPSAAPEWLATPTEHGTTVAILGYGSLDEHEHHEEDLVSDSHRDRIFDSVAKHFMVALYQDRLRVAYVSDRHAPIDLDRNEVGKRLKANSHRHRATRRGYGSGAKAWAAWQTLTDGATLDTDFGLLRYRLTPGKATSVTVFRNGMRITDDAPRLRSSDFKGTNSFNAVLDAQGCLAKVIKDCETDSHLEIKTSLAPGDSGNLAKSGLDIIRNLLASAVGEIDAKEWVPELLRMFTSEAKATDVKPAPPRPRQHRQGELQVISEVSAGGDTHGRTDHGNGQRQSAKPSRGREAGAWRAGNTAGIRRSLVPAGQARAVIEWVIDPSQLRRPSHVGIAVVVGSGSQPSDRRPVPDSALRIRPVGTDDDSWASELRVSAHDERIEVEIENAPQGWEAVAAVVSRRS